MYCYQDTCFNTKGDALPGYYVECLSGASVQDIFADNSSTPIVSVSGVANRAKTDARGNFFFYVEGGTYTLKYYDSNSVYQFSSPEFSVSEQIVTTTETSAGAANAGEVPVLDAADGRLDRTLLAPDGYQRQKFIVLSDTGDVDNLGNFDSTALDSFLQIHGTSDLSTGFQLIKWGNDTKGAQTYYGKSRGATYGTIAPLVAGDRIITKNIQAGTQNGLWFGHVGTERWVIDGTPDSGSEMHGRWTVSTGTGNNASEDAVYYGLKPAIEANARQQVYFPGKLTTSYPAAGVYSTAVVRVGIGGTDQSAMLFDLTSAALMTTPIAGSYEVDSNGVHYITDVNAKRDVVLVGQVKTGGDSGAVAAGAAAGTGPTIDSVVWGNGAVRITFTSGTTPTTGTILTITYPHTFANRSFAFLQAANAISGAYWGRNSYTTCTASQVTISTNGTTLTASTQYAVDVWFNGN